MASAHDVPSDVTAEKGEVHVVGPGGLTYSMTPEAACEISDRLLVGAAQARGQRVEAKWQGDRRTARR